MTKKKAVISVVLIVLFLAVIGVLGFVVFDWFGVTGAAVVEPELESYTYRGPGGGYIFTIDVTKDHTFHIIHYNANGEPYSVPFHNGPRELKKEIPMESGLMDNLVYDVSQGYSRLKLLAYITMAPGIEEESDFKSTVALLTISRVLGEGRASVYNLQTTGASTEKQSGVPHITCDDASWRTAVIELKLGDENRVYTEGDCVIVEGVDGDGLVKSAERLTYLLLKVYYDNLESSY